MTTIAVVGGLVDGRPADVVWRDGVVIDRIDAPARRHPLPSGVDDVLDAEGGELIPGLHDHHVHLAALAAARSSLVAGPPDVHDADELAAALRTAVAGGAAWVRAVGYHESVAGDLDAAALDRMLAGSPAAVRVQHRSGQLWVLNSAAMAATGADRLDHPGVERDATGRANGRLFGLDDWLRDRVPRTSADVAAVAREVAGYGVTGVTDMTPAATADALAPLAAATDPAFPLRLTITGGVDLPTDALAAVPRGPVKLLPPDHRPPDLDELIAQIATAHERGRSVAIHCVTRVGLVVALAAWRDAGVREGDRIEHGAVVPPELFADVRDAGLLVVTQPNLVAERGDHYLADVDPDDLPHLWRLATLLDAGIAVAGGTDPPFGHPDPWRAIAAAVERTTPSGRPLGPGERVTARRALELFLGHADRPTVARRVRPGERTDLCLLDRPLADVLRAPSSSSVRATIGAAGVTVV